MPDAPVCDEWPCTWLTDVEAVKPELLASAKGLAVSLLSTLAVRPIGACTYTDGYWPPRTNRCASPMLDRMWRDTDSYGVGAACCQILLFHRPVVSITSVTEYGNPLTTDEWALDQGRYLRRRFGCWIGGLECNDPPISVTYRAGEDFPDGTDVAVGELAGEYLLAITGKQCRLPGYKANTVSRQGVSVINQGVADYIKAGKVGLPLADAWLRTVNPNALKVQSRVYSPDLARRS